MKKILIIIVVILVLAGAGWYYVKSQPKNSSQNATNSQANSSSNQSSSNQTSNTSGEKSLADLIASGKSLKCTLQVEQENFQGTFYMASGKVRGDFSSKKEDDSHATVVSHLINDGSYSYVWNENETQGAKYASKADYNAQAVLGINQSNPYDFKCEDWSTDQGKFQVPTSVQFMDINSFGNNPYLQSNP